MILLLFVLLQPALTEPIRHLVHTALVTEDRRKERAARAQAQRIVRERDRLIIGELGDEASCQRVWLTCSPQVTCDAANPKLHTDPIEAATHVDERRAQPGLISLSFYAQGIVENGQAACAALAAAAGNR